MGKQESRQEEALENDDGVQDVVEGEYQGYYWVEGLMLLGFGRSGKCPLGARFKAEVRRRKSELAFE